MPSLYHAFITLVIILIFILHTGGGMLLCFVCALSFWFAPAGIHASGLRYAQARSGPGSGLGLGRAWAWVGPGPGSGLGLGRAWAWVGPGPGSGLGLGRARLVIEVCLGQGWGSLCLAVAPAHQVVACCR